MSGNEPAAEIVERRREWSGRLLKVDRETVRLPLGSVCDLELIRHPGAAAVVPLTSDGQVLLVRQYRHATGGWLLEVPAGKLDSGEAPETCARRETEEETGFRPGALTALGWIWTTPGFTDERIWLYLGEALEPGRQALQADEELKLERLPLAEAVRRAERGEIADGKSICALLRAAALLRDRQAVRE